MIVLKNIKIILKGINAVKMKSNKKAMTMNTIVWIIIIIAGFMIIAMVIRNFMTEASAEEAERVCAGSVSVRAAATLGIKGGEIRATPLLCKTIDKEITGDREEIKRQFADHMAKCWEMFGEGIYAKSIFDNLAVFGGKKRCFMCYTLIVEESDEWEGGGISANEFKDFLMNEYHPKIKNMTYLEYFQSHGGKGAVLGVLSDAGIAPKHAYAIGYKAHKDKCSWCKYIAIGGAGAAVVILAVSTGGLGAIAAVAAGTTATVAGATMIGEEFFSEVNIDTIYFVDMNNEQLKQLFANTCEKVEEDIAE